jgi:APA family basic amino acid/polyamine antiporter
MLSNDKSFIDSKIKHTKDNIMTSKSQLERTLGPWQSAAIVVGTIIGTGIFLKTATMTQLLGSSFAVMAAWIVAGLLSYAGALSYAELCSRFPDSGGEYVFLRQAYGKPTAFLYGWMRFWIGSPGSIAAYAVGAATFAKAIGLIQVDQIPGGLNLVAVGLVIFFSGINCLKVRWGARVQTALTILKVLLIIGLAFGVFLFGERSAVEVSQQFAQENLNVFSAFGLALIAALWAFDGWNNLAMVGEEVREPKKNLPVALALGVFAVLVLYLLANWSYFHVLSLSEIQAANSSQFKDALPVATLAAKSFLGEYGVPILSIAFVISALGAMNGSILTGARIPFAMSRDGIFLKSLAVIQSSTHVPARSILIQALVASLLAWSGTFDQLTDWVVVASWSFYALCISTLFIFRKKDKSNDSTIFKVPGFPIVPILFILSAILLVINSMINNPISALLGFVVIVVGYLTYLFFNNRS